MRLDAAFIAGSDAVRVSKRTLSDRAPMMGLMGSEAGTKHAGT